MIMEVAAIEEVTTALGVDMAAFERFCVEAEVDWKRWLGAKRDRRLKDLGLKP